MVIAKFQFVYATKSKTGSQLLYRLFVQSRETRSRGCAWKNGLFLTKFVTELWRVRKNCVHELAKIKSNGIYRSSQQLRLIISSFSAIFSKKLKCVVVVVAIFMKAPHSRERGEAKSSTNMAFCTKPYVICESLQAKAYNSILKQLLVRRLPAVILVVASGATRICCAI